MKKQVKNLLVAITLVAGFIGLGQISTVWGANQTVTCSGGGPCTMSPGGALFQESNWLPGDTVTQTVDVVNDSTTETCDLTIDTKNETVTPAGFEDDLWMVIKNGGADLYGVRDGATRATSDKNLGDLFGFGTFSLGSLSPSSSDSYDWTVTFDSASGNEYQSADLVFDFDLSFSCSAPSAPSGGGGGVLGAASTPVCTDTAPSGAPVLTSVIAGDNTATLTWTSAPGPVSYYLIAFGTSPGVYLYGNPNVGGPETLSYTVTNLSGGQTYYFVVRAGNGCAPGPFSNELVISPAGGFIEGLPTGFLPGVLGVEEEEPSVSPSPVPGVQGEETTVCQADFLWWMPLVVQAVVSLGFITLLSKKGGILTLILGLGIIGGISYIVHLILGCPCSESLCSWYWLLDLGIVVLAAGLYYFIAPLKKEAKS